MVMSNPGELTSEAESPGESRDFVRYTFLHLRCEWRRLSIEDRRQGREEAARVIEKPPPGLRLRTYSLVGTKAGVEALLWMVAPGIEPFQYLETRLWGTRIGGYLDVPFAYLGMGRHSEYLGGHVPENQERSRVRQSDRRYLFVYPFVKRREWYSLPFDERRRIMGEHFRIGRKFPNVEIHTAYSFGLDDPEFILAFESDNPSEFLDLVQALRPSEASRYTAQETPIFTCIGTEPLKMLELADGIVK